MGRARLRHHTPNYQAILNFEQEVNRGDQHEGLIGCGLSDIIAYIQQIDLENKIDLVLSNRYSNIDSQIVNTLRTWLHEDTYNTYNINITRVKQMETDKRVQNK